MRVKLLLMCFIAAAFYSCKKEAATKIALKESVGKADIPLKILIEKRVIKGFKEPRTPERFNRVGYNRYYLSGQRNSAIPVLIIISGYVADTAWFDRMARDLVMRKNIEVWTINRRETFIENRNILNKDIDSFIKNRNKRKAIIRKLNKTANYLKGSEEYIKYWGLNVQIEDMKAVVEEAKKTSKNIFLGGWSDGVEYLMAYSNYKFKKTFGSADLKGLVFYDENPEWGKLSGKDELLKKKIDRQIRLMEQNHLYMKYFPSLAVHTLALKLADIYPDKKSPLADYFKLPEEIKSRGITNRALIGWLYDRDIDSYDKKARGPFAYLIRSGSLPALSDEGGGGEEKSNNPDEKAGILKWTRFKDAGDITDLDRFIAASSSVGTMWEHFYPRKVLLDYFRLGKCDFDCPEMNIYHNKENRLPIFYILTGTNNVGKSAPLGLKWFMQRSGITLERVKFVRLYKYAHGDMFFAENAPEELYSPLYNWILDNCDGKIIQKR